VTEFETFALARIVPDHVGFFTPLFRSRQSDALYMQQYNREHRIERFLPIDDNSDGIEELEIRRTRQVSDEALFGFIFSTGEILLGTRIEIAPQLRIAAHSLVGTRLLKDVTALFRATSTPLAPMERSHEVSAEPTFAVEELERRAVVARLVAKGYLPPRILTSELSRDTLTLGLADDMKYLPRNRTKFVRLHGGALRENYSIGR
jgi:hypothetical protein